MKIKAEHIQPMNISNIVTFTFDRAKQIFLLSMPGNAIILFALSLILFTGYDYAEALGSDEKTLYTLSLFNNLLLISVTSVHIFYLLLINGEQPYIEQVKQALIKTIITMPTIIVATLIYALLVIFGLTLLMIPGLIIYAYLGLFVQTIVFENKGIMNSLLRSRELVRGSFWKVFLSLLGILIVTNVVVLAIGAVVFSFIPGFTLWIETIIYTVAYMLFMPFIGVFYTLLYFGLRSEQEAFDYESFKRELVDQVMI